MIKLLNNINLEGYTMIVPSVAVGNVAQLTVDLLIYNTKMTKIGQMYCPDFIPFLGADPYDEKSSDICTTGDLYIQKEKRIFVLQIRSPPVNNVKNFSAGLQKFVTAQKIAKVRIPPVSDSEYQ